MKTALRASTALLLAGAIYIHPANAQVQVQPAPGFSVQIGPGAPPAPPPPRGEWREREGFSGSGREERRDEKWGDGRGGCARGKHTRPGAPPGGGVEWNWVLRNLQGPR